LVLLALLGLLPSCRSWFWNPGLGYRFAGTFTGQYYASSGAVPVGFETQLTGIQANKGSDGGESAYSGSPEDHTR
jgi:hypothetical protein